MLSDDIASRFGAKLVGLREIRPGQGGAVIFEATLDGAPRALRISGTFLSERPSWIEFEGELLAQVRDAGISVAAAQKGVDGQFGQPVFCGIALLTEWAEGDIEWPTPTRKAEILGRTVAKMHQASGGFAERRDVRCFDTLALLDRPISLLTEIVDVTPLSPFIEEMRKRIDAIPKTEQTFGAIHGDIHQGNCHFNEDSATLFDFAQCGVGWRAFDLAGFLWPWRDASIEDPALRNACDGCLRGYQTDRRLSREELVALPAFVRAREIWETGEWIAVGDGRQKPEAVQAEVERWLNHWSKHPLPELLA